MLATAAFYYYHYCYYYCNRHGFSPNSVYVVSRRESNSHGAPSRLIFPNVFN